MSEPSAPPSPARSGRPDGVHAVGAVRSDDFVFRRAPMLVYWELTRACGLVCRHCRASAAFGRDPRELTFDECLRVLDQVASFGTPPPHVVLTGGDPLRRPDLEDIVRAATQRRIGVSLAPAVTPDLTRERLVALQTSGIQTISLSLDGSTAARHDGVRQVPGTFDMTMAALEMAADIGLPVQVNTLVARETLADLWDIYELLKTKQLVRWSLFFLITVGRGATLREITPGEAERLFHRLHALVGESPFQIKTTEATHYRRVALRHMEHQGCSPAEIARSSVGRGFGVRDGNGICFIDHRGRVHPSGFLPVVVGDLHTDDLVTLYRTHPTFTSLRDVTQLAGRCGACEFATRCGGSRARAFATTGSFLESDPLCPYQPPAWRRRAKALALPLTEEDR